MNRVKLLFVIAEGGISKLIGHSIELVLTLGGLLLGMSMIPSEMLLSPSFFTQRQKLTPIF